MALQSTTRQSLTGAISSNSRLDYALLFKILSLIEVRLAPLEGERDEAAAVIEQLRDLAVNRINDVLIPAIETVLRIQENGFLIAHSSTSATFGLGNIMTLTVTDPDERALFAPAKFAIVATDNPDDYAIVETVSFDKDDGIYVGEIVAYHGATGPHTELTIGALAGSTTAQVVMLNTALAAQADIAAKYAEIVDIAALLESALEAIQEGAVISVNGQGGIVALDYADVGAAPTSHAHTMEQITGLVSALASKATPGNINTAISAIVLEFGTGGLSFDGGQF